MLVLFFAHLTLTLVALFSFFNFLSAFDGSKDKLRVNYAKMTLSMLTVVVCFVGTYYLLSPMEE